jgi:sugar/nucleoside kinase (ribokinase family)
VYRLEAGSEATAKPPFVEVVSATGAGDAFLAGSLRARILGLDAAEECAAGCAAAVTALGSAHACPPSLNAVTFEAMLSAWKRSGAIAWKEERT